jgi:Ras family protein A
MRFSDGSFDADAYVPTVFENYVKDLSAPDGSGRIELTLWDTAGQEDYDRLRPLSYPDTDVVLIAFSVDSPDSLNNVYDKWVQEVRHFCPGVPVMLVALKRDLRADPETIQRCQQRDGRGPVSVEEGQKAARDLRCEAFVECSSKTGENVLQVFERASVLGKQSHKRHTCVIL